MASDNKQTYEGMYLGGAGMVICTRLETGGVPRFENVVIRPDMITREVLEQVYRFCRQVESHTTTAPWMDDMLPGIG